MRPNKMALWNEFLPCIEETVEPTTRTSTRKDLPTKRSNADNKKGIADSFNDVFLVGFVLFV